MGDKPVKIIDLNTTPLVCQPIGEAEIKGEQLELAVCDETDMPVVIHRASNRAWAGSWDELVTCVAEVLLDGDDHGSSHY